MARKSDILVACDMCVDLIMHGEDVVPEFGQKEKLVDDYSLELGGSCSIFASQAAKLGLQVAALGKVGNDSFGELVIRKLHTIGVDTGNVIVEPSLKTGIGIALCTDRDRAILTYTGSIDALMPSDMTDAMLQSCRHLHIGSYYLLSNLRPAFADMARKVRGNGGTVSLDTNWDPAERWDGVMALLPHVDVFLPNENELLAIAGTDDRDEAIEAVGALCGVVAVKQGSLGAIAYSEGRYYAEPPIPIDFVDGIGAGDSFDAGFLYGYLQGLPIPQCLKLGNICGAQSATARGGIAGQVTQARLSDYWQA